jgi:hypothetical protein
MKGHIYKHAKTNFRMQMTYLSSGIDKMHLVLMSGGTVSNALKGLEINGKGKTLVTGKSD